MSASTHSLRTEAAAFHPPVRRGQSMTCAPWRSPRQLIFSPNQRCSLDSARSLDACFGPGFRVVPVQKDIATSNNMFIVTMHQDTVSTLVSTYTVRAKSLQSSWTSVNDCRGQGRHPNYETATHAHAAWLANRSAAAARRVHTSACAMSALSASTRGLRQLLLLLP